MTPLVQPSSTPGQMTAVMRAVARPGGSRALRAALVRGGKILDERVLALGEHLTVGPTERSLFVVAGLRSSVRLLEWSRAGYQLHLGPGMSARVALGGEVTEVGGQRAPVALDDEARGRIAVGDAVVLFHFVEPAVAAARPQLPLAVKQGWFDGFDWSTTCVAAFSFLVHFGAVGAAYSDFADTVIEDDGARVMDTVGLLRAESYPSPLLPVEVAGGVATPTLRDPGRPAGEGARAQPGPHAGPERLREDGGRASDVRARSLARQLAAESGAMLQALGGASGEATGSVLAGGQVPADMMDDIARGPGGTRTTGNPSLNLTASMGPVRPGAGRPGAEGTYDGKRDVHTDDSGSVVAPKKPIPGTVVEWTGTEGGEVPGAGGVVARMRGALRACYKHALDEDPTMRGTVRVTAKIGPNGEVTSVQATTGGLSSSMVGCVRRVVGGAQFNPPTSGGALVTIPMTFLPQ